MRSCSIGCAGLALLALMIAQAASASVQEYQILRLLSYHSECQVTAVHLMPHAAGRAAAAARYHADCENVALYPDGVDVECDDREDERSCHVLTQSKAFESLDLLSPEKLHMK